MVKNIVIAATCLVILGVLGVGCWVFEWPEKCSNTPQIGTAIGPGEGHLSFPLGKGKTQIEAIAVTKAIPQVGDELSAEVCPGFQVKGQVVNVMCFEKGRGVVTILTLEKGLVTTGIIVKP